jgi:membrane-bound lytic murein transglycosylase MltF
MQEFCIHDIDQSIRQTGNPTDDFKRLSAALEKVAMLVVDNPIYLPIFERIEFELAALNVQYNAVSRARAIAARSQMALA